MKKMTVRELQCRLYVENLREQYKNRDFMFTTFGEKELEYVTKAIEIEIEDIEKKEALSDEDLKKSWDDPFMSISDIRENLKCVKEYHQGEILTERKNCKDHDFALALLFTCWKEKFASEKDSDAAIVDSYIQHELVIDSENICTNVLKDIYLEYASLNKRWRVSYMYKEEILRLISLYDGWGGERSLEIDTDFWDKSTKVVSKEIDYIISKVIRDLIGCESEIYRNKELSQMPRKKTFDTIVARVSACKNQSLDGISEFFNDLANRTNKNGGRIILIDKEHILASEEMYDFRKKLIEDSLLEIYVDGWHMCADIYILRVHEASGNVVFNFVSSHQHSSSIYDNFLTLHNKLSKEDVKSIDYDFHKTSDLLLGQQGKAYAFRNLFSIPKSGVEEKKVLGLHHVFQMKDMPRYIKESIKTSADLDVCDISGSFKELTENKLVIFVGDDKIQCCYVEASEDKPIFVGHQFAVLDLNSEILIPEYVQMLCAKEIMEKVFDDGYMKRSDYRYTNCEFDSYVGKSYTITPEEKILSLSTMIQIPSCEQQRKEILDAQFINASAVERERALELLLAEKTWLNEEHIRNIKHRIGNELLPIKNDIDAMVKLFEKHPEGLTLDTVRGKNERVSEIINRLTRCISKVNESLQDLTRTVDKGNLKPVDIVATVRDFVRDVSTNKIFNISLSVPSESIKVNGSTNMINSILRNILDNAVRHGFVDKLRQDYVVEITIQKDGNGNCVLDVKNNGNPMDEQARNCYFKRGSVSGITGHSGIGGADIKDTANAMGGEVTLPMDEDRWSVCVRISLPIFNSEKI